MMHVGVLALQGAFEAHCKCIRALHATAVYVKKWEDLKKCQALILPGGESTTMMRLIDERSLRDPLIAFALEKPIFGTCAGLIMLAKWVENAPFNPLGLLDIKVRRNAYGRQVDSFRSEIVVKTCEKKHSVPAFFIRAPQITDLLSDKIEILATHSNMPIFVRQNNLFAATFHAELTDNLFCHSLFLQSVK